LEKFEENTSEKDETKPLPAPMLENKLVKKKTGGSA